MAIRSKLPDAGTTIFTTMSALAAQHQAINLSQGFPDFDCDITLRELAAKYIASGHNQYAPLPGVLKLRERISAIIEDCYQAKYDPASEIIITAGATQAIFTAIAAFVSAGDEVIVFEPAYDCYAPAIEVQGGRTVYCTLRGEDFHIDWDEVAACITSRTKAIIINNPHNPTGSILSADDLKRLSELAHKHDLVVISDEVYEHMVFDGRRHESVARYPALKNRALLVSSFGKTLHATGWKIGYVAGPAALITEFRKVHQFLVFVVNHPLQHAVADYLADKTNYAGIRDFYQRKRDFFLALTAASRLKPLPCSGTYFQLMSYESIDDRDDATVAIDWTREKGVATIPLSAFYANKTKMKILRFCFAKRDETLRRAAEILCKL